MSRILGLDVGDRRIGLALSDPLGWTAQGRGLLERTTLEADLAWLQEQVAAWSVSRIVVGLPRSLNGSLGPQAQKVLSFVEALRKVVSVPVEVWDERLSTREAERILLEAGLSRRRRRRHRDPMAAVLILQSYLDHARHTHGPPS